MRVAPCEQPRSRTTEELILTSEEKIANFALADFETARFKPLPARLSTGIFIFGDIVA